MRRELTLLAGGSLVVFVIGCGGADDAVAGDSASAATAATFDISNTMQLIREQEIGQPGVVYMDPEFHPETFQVAFYQGINEVYVGQIDARTGRFVDHAYQHVSSGAPIVLTFNGPEFGESRSGTGLYFTGVDAARRLHTFRYRDGQLTQLDAGQQSIVANYPSKNAADPAALVMGVALPGSDDGNVDWAIFSEDRPDQIRTFDMEVIGKGARFVPGQRRATTNLRDPQGIVQVAIYDFDQDRTAQATFDGDNKDSAAVFQAPELGGELLLFALVNSGKSIRVYRESQGQWQPYRELAAPIGARYVNPQVFSFRGHTLFSVNTKVERSDNSDILLLFLDNNLRLKVSGSSTMKRFDPETLVSGDHIFIYYYDLASGRLFLSDLILPADLD